MGEKQTHVFCIEGKSKVKVYPPQPRDSILDLVPTAGALEPSGEEAVRPLPRQKGITGSSGHLAPTSKLKEKNQEPSNSCTEQIQFGDVNDIWTRFPDLQVKSEE